jgi:hypothetical protein
MKVLITLTLMIFICSCSSFKTVSKEKISSSYLVREIKSKNDWYIIYAIRKDSTYKIVAKKEEAKAKYCKKIAVGHYYDFILHSMRENAPVINGVKLQPANYLDIHCYSYDSRTEICIEPKKGIYDLYSAENLKGLCISK